MTASERRRNLLAEQERLETVEHYCGDYVGIIRSRELAGQSSGSLRMYREFSGWLTELAQNQKNQVAQAEFLLEAAAEEARDKRSFVSALQRAAEKSGQSAEGEARALEQKTLDGLVRPRYGAALARGLQNR